MAVGWDGCWFELILLFILNSSPQVKASIVLTDLNIRLKLLVKLVASNLSMWAEACPFDTCHT